MTKSSLETNAEHLIIVLLLWTAADGRPLLILSDAGEAAEAAAAAAAPDTVPLLTIVPLETPPSLFWTAAAELPWLRTWTITEAGLTLYGEQV